MITVQFVGDFTESVDVACVGTEAWEIRMANTSVRIIILTILQNEKKSDKK